MVARVYLRLARLVRRTMGWLTVATTCSDACRARRDGRRRRRYALRVRWPAALLLVLIAAPPAAHAQPARWRGTGVVVAVLPAPSSLHATRPVIVLDHQPIAGLMEQRMSMPFIRRPPTSSAASRPATTWPSRSPRRRTRCSW